MLQTRGASRRFTSTAIWVAHPEVAVGQDENGVGEGPSGIDSYQLHGNYLPAAHADSETRERRWSTRKCCKTGWR